MIFQLYSAMLSIKQLFFPYDFHTAHRFKTELWVIEKLLAYGTVGVHQNDLTMPELQPHLFQKWTAFQQSIVDELIEQWHRLHASVCAL